MTSRPCSIIAHRGASFEAPENTVAAARLAWEMGADGLEVDIHLTADGEVVVIHDTTTGRTSGYSLTVAASTASELAALDVGAYKGEQWIGESLPTLGEIVATVPREKLLVIELKAGPELLEPLGRVLDAGGLALAQVCLITFSFALAELAKQHFPQAKVLWLYGNPGNLCGEAWKARVNELILKGREAGLDGLDLWAHPDLDEEVVSRVHAAGLELLVWTVNDPAHGLRLRDAGVNGITTDIPDKLLARLSQLEAKIGYFLARVVRKPA